MTCAPVTVNYEKPLIASGHDYILFREQISKLSFISLLKVIKESLKESLIESRAISALIRKANFALTRKAESAFRRPGCIFYPLA